MNTPAYFCMDDITLSSVGISEIVASNISVFPNPAKNFVVVKADNITEINITDLSGKVVCRKKLNASEEKINVSIFESGIYIISVKNDNSVYTQKLIIE